MGKDDWYFAISTLLSLVALLGVDWKLVAGRTSMSNQKRQIFLLIVISLSLISSFWSWRTVVALRGRVPYAEFHSAKNRMGAMISWGGSAVQEGKPVTQVTVDGEAVLAFKGEYKLAGIAFHDTGRTEIKDIQVLSKSGRYDIVPGFIRMVFEFSTGYQDEFNQGKRGTDYMALLVPNQVQMQDFSTIRQAESMGVIAIGDAGGPP